MGDRTSPPIRQEHQHRRAARGSLEGAGRRRRTIDRVKKALRETSILTSTVKRSPPTPNDSSLGLLTTPPVSPKAPLVSGGAFCGYGSAASSWECAHALPDLHRSWPPRPGRGSGRRPAGCGLPPWRFLPDLSSLRCHRCVVSRVVIWGDASGMASRGLLEVEVRYLEERGDAVAGRLAEVNAEAVVAGRLVRRFPRVACRDSPSCSARDRCSPMHHSREFAPRHPHPLHVGGPGAGTFRGRGGERARRRARRTPARVTDL